MSPKCHGLKALIRKQREVQLEFQKKAHASLYGDAIDTHQHAFVCFYSCQLDPGQLCHYIDQASGYAIVEQWFDSPKQEEIFCI